MKKLTLQLEDLSVESFATDAAAAERRTVHGNAATFACQTNEATCADETCVHYHTCEYDTCADPCGSARCSGTGCWDSDCGCSGPLACASGAMGCPTGGVTGPCDCP